MVLVEIKTKCYGMRDSSLQLGIIFASDNNSTNEVFQKLNHQNLVLKLYMH